MRMIGVIPGIPVVEIDAAVAFYRDKLGFNVFYQEASFARLRRNDVELQLWAASDDSWQTRPAATPFQAIVSGAETFLAGTGGCRIQVEGIDDLYAEYREQRVLYNSDTTIVTEWWGDRDFHVLDLHGNLLSFFETPSS